MKATTTQARRKFRKRWPFKQLRVSALASPAAEAVFATVELLSFVCCDASISFGPTTFCAIELQISHVLKMTNDSKILKEEVKPRLSPLPDNLN